MVGREHDQRFVIARLPGGLANDAVELERAQRLVDGRARGSRDARELVLGQGDDDPLVRGAVYPGEVGEPTDHTPLDGHEQRVEQLHVQLPHLGGEELDQELVDSRMIAAETTELALRDGERFRALQRFDRRRARRARAHDRHLAEAVPRSPDRDRRLVAERCRDANRKPAFRDQVQRIRRITLVEDDLAARERAATGNRDQPANLLARDSLEQPPLHRRERRSLTGGRQPSPPPIPAATLRNAPARPRSNRHPKRR